MTDTTTQQTPDYSDFKSNFARVFHGVHILMTAQEDLPKGHADIWPAEKRFAVWAALTSAERTFRELEEKPTQGRLRRLFGLEAFGGSLTLMQGLAAITTDFEYADGLGQRYVQQRRIPSDLVPTREQIWAVREQIRQFAQAGSRQDLSHLAYQI